MAKDIGEIVSQCLNNKLIQHYFLKKKSMTYEEQEEQRNNFSKMIGYCILFRETEGIEEYMNLNSYEQQIQFLKSRIANKLNIPYDEIQNRIEDIINFAFDNFIKNGFVFHAGNSNAIENNMKYGLEVSKTLTEEQIEMMNIAYIYSKYGNDDPFGWGMLDINNKRKGWFYDDVPRNMLYYADSPEWFNQFCGVNHCYGWGLVPEENRHGYSNRDYEVSLLTITKLIEKNNMLDSDKKEILDFFNKYWNKFANTEPCLLFVPNNSIREDSSLELMRELYLGDDSIFIEIIKGGCGLMGLNICCDKKVNPEVLSSVNLLPILPRYKQSENIKQREMTIIDCIKKLNNLDSEHLLKAQEILEQYLIKSNERGVHHG